VELSDPTLVFLLVTLGLVGIGVEALTPGGFLPGLVGVAALVLGVIGYIDIDAPSGGVGLLLVSIAFFIAAAALKRYRALSAAGTLFLILSGIFMFDRGSEPTSIPAVLVAGLVLGGFMMFVIERAGTARTRPVKTGWEELIGMTGEVRSGLGPVGQVFIDGALWRAELSPESEPVTVGTRVQVEAVEGLTLIVSKVRRTEAASSQTDKEGVVQ
jgi:membrane-bound serine protease (ClpP class)